jgi:sigma-B regulation protein RsbU (phosphoserine phosphatase)
VTKEILPGGYRILPPGEALQRLNAALAGQSFSQTTFATAVYGVIDATSGEIKISRAGHPLPVLLPSGDAPPRGLGCGGGALLGVFPEEKFHTESFRLRPGDRLFVHSDGVDAVCSETGTEENGAWMRRLLGVRAQESARILSDFAHELDRKQGSLAPKDDLTIISVEMQEKQVARTED